MLDQNTDRMWYVIGAVIIGAAIILILNGTAPQLFASVGDAFQSKLEPVTEEVDGIFPKSRLDKEIYAKWQGVNLAYGTDEMKVTQKHESNGYYAINDDALSEMIGGELTLSFDIKSPDGSGGYARALMITPDRAGIAHSRSESYPLTEQWVRHTHTFTFTQSIYDQLITHDGVGRVGVKSNQYVTGNDGERFPHLVRNLKLELGKVATPYSLAP